MRIKMGDQPPSTTTGSSFRRVVELIASLISLTLLIRVFVGKWQLIRTKLEDLHSELISGDATSLSDMLPTITGIVEECHELARRCVDLSYSRKLLMQSDLDVTLGKLEMHMKKLHEIHKKNVLMHSYAMVVSKPCLGAYKEDMRFYLRDLLTRMKVGDLDMKKQALINLNDVVVVEDDKYVKLVVVVSNFVHLLVDFLCSYEVEIQEECAKVVSAVAGIDSYKGILIANGVISPLIQVLECKSKMGKVGVTKVWSSLSYNIFKD